MDRSTTMWAIRTDGSPSEDEFDKEEDVMWAIRTGGRPSDVEVLEDTTTIKVPDEDEFNKKQDVMWATGTGGRPSGLQVLPTKTTTTTTITTTTTRDTIDTNTITVPAMRINGEGLSDPVKQDAISLLADPNHLVLDGDNNGDEPRPGCSGFQVLTEKSTMRVPDEDESNKKKKVMWAEFFEEYRQHKEAPLTIQEEKCKEWVMSKCIGNGKRCSGLNACLDKCHPRMAFESCKALAEHRILCERLHTTFNKDNKDVKTEILSEKEKRRNVYPMYNCVGSRQIWFCHDKMNKSNECVKLLLEPIEEVNLSAIELKWVANVYNWCEDQCKNVGACIGALCLDPCHQMLKFENCRKLMMHLIRCKGIHNQMFAIDEDCDGSLKTVAFHRFSNIFDLLDYIDFEDVFITNKNEIYYKRS